MASHPTVVDLRRVRNPPHMKVAIPEFVIAVLKLHTTTTAPTGAALWRTDALEKIGGCVRQFAECDQTLRTLNLRAFLAMALSEAIRVAAAWGAGGEDRLPLVEDAMGRYPAADTLMSFVERVTTSRADVMTIVRAWLGQVTPSPW